MRERETISTSWGKEYSKQDKQCIIISTKRHEQTPEAFTLIKEKQWKAPEASLIREEIVPRTKALGAWQTGKCVSNIVAGIYGNLKNVIAFLNILRKL